jgi:filamentous hemagglutinin family protein
MMTTKFWLCFLTLTSFVVSTQTALAQTYQPSNRTPVSDNTLGTQVSGNGNNFNITGGLNKGQTLFHSFTDFSVPTNGQANFTNPTGNRDIITRVTGGVFSDINGLVNTNGANFFLINPNGIVFGTNAQLNVGKAFVGSTASSIDLVDAGGRTITFGTNANGDAPLLSVAPNVLFDVSRLNMGGGTGAISNFGTLQTNNPSQYIGLIGGNVTLDGGKIIAPGGRVDIGGLNSGGTVMITSDGLVFGGSNPTRSNVTLTNGAVVNVRAVGTLDTVNTFFNNATAPGSSINISANNLDILNSGFKSANEPAAIDAGLAENSGTYDTTSGDVNFNATGKVTIDNSYIKNTLRTGATGNIGGIKINANGVEIKNESLISTVLSGRGNVGDITISSSGDVNLTDRSAILSDNSQGSGNAGNIDIKSGGNVNITDRSFISSDNINGTGNAGNIDIKANNLNINKSLVRSETDGTGNAGNININASNLNITNNSLIASNNSGGTGNAGNIDIKTTGDINISGFTDPSLIPSQTTKIVSGVSSSTNGNGDAGKITIVAQGDLSLNNTAFIFSTIDKQAIGNSLGININAKNLNVTNDSSISTINLGGRGNNGSINLKADGDITIAGFTNLVPAADRTAYSSSINSQTSGQGDSGKITIDAKGKFLLTNRGVIANNILPNGIGSGGEIKISGRDLEVSNGSFIATDTLQTNRVNGTGNAGDIQIQASGDIKISGYNLPLTDPANASTASISSSTTGQGDAGKITIDAQGKLSIVNRGTIEGAVLQTAVGNGKSISISARELELANGSNITASTYQATLVDGTGNGGDINIKTTGDIQIAGSTNFNASKSSQIASNSYGKGDAGKITIDTQGKLLLVNQGIIASALLPSAVGNSQGVKINARELELANGSAVATTTFQNTKVAGKGNAGDIEVKTSGDIKLAGVDAVSYFTSSTYGQGDAGKITIDTQGKLSLFDGSPIFNNVGKPANGNGRDISISAREIELNKSSFIATSTDQIVQVNSNGKSGDVNLKVKDTISFKNNSGISTRSTGAGQAGNVSITATQLLVNESGLLSDSTSASSGGNVTISLSDKLLLRNGSFITTTSGSSEKNGNGGNITISSPLIIALPGDSPRDNDITANAYQGTGGKVNIASQGLFGIKYRPIGSDFTSDITASSQFGQSGTVNIDTPGTDPGRDTTELPNATTDASNQISQVCSASTSQNKLTVTGRGGLPPNANDPLTSDVVWQDARATSSQPASSSVPKAKLEPPAVGWVFDGKGKVTLVAAGTEGQSTKASVVCPNVEKH